MLDVSVSLFSFTFQLNFTHGFCRYFIAMMLTKIVHCATMYCDHNEANIICTSEGRSSNTESRTGKKTVS